MSDIGTPQSSRRRPSEAAGALALRVAVAFAVVGLAACGSGGDTEKADVVMPDVVGQQLDEALSDIERAGFTDEVEVLGGGTFGIVNESNWQVCDQLPAAGDAVTSQPRLSVDRTCPAAEPIATEPLVTAPASSQSTTAPTVPPTVATIEQAPASTEPEPTPYAYVGPQYQIVAQYFLPVGLNEIYVLTDKLDYSTDSYRDQLKLVIADVARAQGTAQLNVNVVTDIEIALLESFPTTQAFYDEHGDDYVNQVVVPKEVTDWVAAYSGGYDYDAGELSNADNAFEVIWFPYGVEDIEKWKPTWS